MSDYKCRCCGQDASLLYPCCKHCVDDPIFHEDNPPDSHTIGCTQCDDDYSRVSAWDTITNPYRAEP
jgi:hypothetical protein